MPDVSAGLIATGPVVDPIQPALDPNGAASRPEDDVILATAVSGNADFLVIAAQQLRRLQAFRGVSIVSPCDTLAVLGTA